MSLHKSIKNAVSHLLDSQREDGHFEGELSANTFPTCAYALVQMALGRPVDADLIEWFIEGQNDDGTWGLDVSGVSDSEATLFAQLVLKEIKRIGNRDVCPTEHERYADSLGKIEAVLAKSPDLPLNLWIVKLMYARCGYISWEEVMPPRLFAAFMRLAEWLRPVLPESLLSRVKPPVRFAPPVRLFYSPAFQDLFIAEKYTLVPLFLIMEIHTSKRKEVVAELTNWLLENGCTDGSWFRVGLITAISLMALIDAKASGYAGSQAANSPEYAELESALREGVEWLQGLRTSDGGCREAVNLNVWDTALSVISVVETWHAVFPKSDEYRSQIGRAATWLVENQNEDGGWPFSGLPGGNLPSDADDTALAALALLRAGFSRDHAAVRRSIEWFKAHQSADGGWGTYVPGEGDVSCVSVTSHVVEACLAMDEHAAGLSEEMESAITWLKAVISDSGYWSDLWLARNTYGTALAIAALVKSGHADCSEVKRGVKWLEENQNADGGWGEDMEGRRGQSTVEQTAWSTYALLLAEHAAESPGVASDEARISGRQVRGGRRAAQKGIEYLLRYHNSDGSWPSSCVGIYWEVIGGYTDPIYPSVFALMALSQAASM